MDSDIRSPAPVRPPKRTLTDTDFAQAPARPSKHPCLSPISPVRSVEHYQDDSKRFNRLAVDRVLQTASCASGERRQPDGKPLELSAAESYKLQPTALNTAIQNWVSGVSEQSHLINGGSAISRPNSAPPAFSSRDQLNSIRDSTHALSLAHLRRTSHASTPRQNSVSTTQSGRLNTSSPLYRSLIQSNNIILDTLGRKIPQDIQRLLNTHILKRRDSPPLVDAEIFTVMATAADLMDYAESRVGDMFNTKALPAEHPGIAEGRNVQWTTEPLPKIPRYPHELAAPKPNRHYGYFQGSESGWSLKERATVEHRAVLPYAQPTMENLFPFFMVEIEAECTGGTTYVAENKAVGSLVHSVQSLRWLLSEAGLLEASSPTDVVAFAVALSARLAVFYICWYSDSEQCHFVSKFKNVLFTNGPEDGDIQACRDITKSIIEYGVEVRQATVRSALAKLDPPPQHWKKARPVSVTSESPPTSLGVDDHRSSRSRR